MSSYDLSKPTVIFGLHLWVVVGICAGAAFVLLLVIISFWFSYRRSSRSKRIVLEVQRVTANPSRAAAAGGGAGPSPLPIKQTEEEKPIVLQRIQIDTGKEHRITYPEHHGGGGSSHTSGENRSVDQSPPAVPEVSHLGWGHWYTLRELEVATGMFTDENVIGEGGYGIVYLGVVEDGTQIAVKNLLNNSYVAPEYASTGMLNESSDVYSFGILIMEVISGRTPVDYSRPPGEVNLVDWLKTMVSIRNSEGVLDPKIAEKPSSRELKRTLLVALKCVDPDSHKRPKMGHVIHMLEADDFPYRDDNRAGRDQRRAYYGSPQGRLTGEPAIAPAENSSNGSVQIVDGSVG